jgi:hypothetical protein
VVRRPGPERLRRRELGGHTNQLPRCLWWLLCGWKLLWSTGDPHEHRLLVLLGDILVALQLEWHHADDPHEHRLLLLVLLVRSILRVQLEWQHADDPDERLTRGIFVIKRR